MKKTTVRAYSIIASIILLACIAMMLNASERKNSAAYDLGKQVTQIHSDQSGGKIVATINGTNFTKNQLDTYRLTMNQGGKEYSDTELMDRLIKRTVLYDEAVRRGLTVTDAEIDEAIASTKDALNHSESKQAKEYLDSYLSGAGISEDQYWENVNETYKLALPIGKLQDTLKKSTRPKTPMWVQPQRTFRMGIKRTMIAL